MINDDDFFIRQTEDISFEGDLIAPFELTCSCFTKNGDIVGLPLEDAQKLHKFLGEWIELFEG
jgi:hypothetical protein